MTAFVGAGFAARALLAAKESADETEPAEPWTAARN